MFELIEAIIFDFGNVICTLDNNLFLEKISKYTDKTVPELTELIYTYSDLPQKFETGLISPDKFYKEIVKKCNLSISKPDFIEAYTNIFTPIPATFNLIERLKTHNYKLALLSNTSEWDFEYGIKPKMAKIFDLFDAVTTSFEAKAMKPKKEIFLDTLNKLGLKPEQCVYIDDIQRYVEAANKLGMYGIHYNNSHDGLIASLKGLDVSF